METRETLKVHEAAKILGIGRDAAYLGIKRGEIPSIKIGRKLLVPRAPFERMIGTRTDDLSKAA